MSSEKRFWRFSTQGSAQHHELRRPLQNEVADKVHLYDVCGSDWRVFRASGFTSMV